MSAQPLTAGRARVRDVVALARPRFWIASAVMLELGFVLVTHRLMPRGTEVLDLLHAFVVTGPLVWLAVLAINDAYDLDGDRCNPRKAGSPLVRGRITPREAVSISAAAGALAVLVAMPLGAWFAVGTAAVVVLGWAYSVPPLRLKERAGADVLANAVVGILGPLSGWVALTGSPHGFPWPIAVVAVTAAAALYLPTTLADHDPDRRTGVRTVAVVLGRRATFELGFALWTTSAVLALVLAMAGVVVDAALIPLHLVMMPILLALYRRLLKDAPSFSAVTIVAVAYLVPCIAFAVTYVEGI